MELRWDSQVLFALAHVPLDIIVRLEVSPPLHKFVDPTQFIVQKEVINRQLLQWGTTAQEGLLSLGPHKDDVKKAFIALTEGRRLLALLVAMVILRASISLAQVRSSDLSLLTSLLDCLLKECVSRGSTVH
jgi:hypothetical protein